MNLVGTKCNPCAMALFAIMPVSMVACSGQVSAESPGQAGSGAGGTASTDSPRDFIPDDVPTPPEAGPRPTDCGPAAGSPLPTGLRRLTVEEAWRSLDLAIGLDARSLTERLPKDVRAHEGFRTNAGVLTASPDFIGALDEAARSLAPSIDMALVRFAPCRRFETPCEESFIREMGLRLFRRPLEDTQVSAFRKLFAIAKDQGDSFEVGAGLVFRTLIQSPQFIYRLEREEDGAPRTLDAWEVASRLSFLSWGTGPDDQLLDAAESGVLLEKNGLSVQLDRLLSDPRSQPMLRTYASEWLGIDDLSSIHRDSARYGVFTDAIKADMQEETLRFFDEAWETDLPIGDLATAPFTWASEGLAKLYGLPSPRPGITRYDLGEGEPRLGLFTQGSFLTAHAGGDIPKVVERGVSFFKSMLCQLPLDPPAGIDLSLNQKPLGQGVTERTNSEARMKAGVCGACHSQFDPLAHPYERYDAIGRYMELDQYGNALRDDGLMSWQGPNDNGEPTDRAYANVREFSKLIAEDTRFFSCAVQKPAQFALGRGLEPDGGDACYLFELRARTASRGGSLREAFRAVAEHPHFRVVAAMPASL